MQWSVRGYCDDGSAHHRYMEIECQVACGMCSPVTRPTVYVIEFMQSASTAQTAITTAATTRFIGIETGTNGLLPLNTVSSDSGAPGDSVDHAAANTAETTVAGPTALPVGIAVVTLLVCCLGLGFCMRLRKRRHERHVASPMHGKWATGFDVGGVELPSSASPIDGMRPTWDWDTFESVPAVTLPLDEEDALARRRHRLTTCLTGESCTDDTDVDDIAHSIDESFQPPADVRDVVSPPVLTAPDVGDDTERWHAAELEPSQLERERAAGKLVAEPHGQGSRRMATPAAGSQGHHLKPALAKSNAASSVPGEQGIVGPGGADVPSSSSMPVQTPSPRQVVADMAAASQLRHVANSGCRTPPRFKQPMDSSGSVSSVTSMSSLQNWDKVMQGHIEQRAQTASMATSFMELFSSDSKAGNEDPTARRLSSLGLAHLGEIRNFTMTPTEQISTFFESQSKTS